MGLFSFLGIGDEEKPSTKEDKSSGLISDEASFVTEDEDYHYQLSMLGQLRNHAEQIDFICEYLPIKGADLKKQNQAIIDFILLKNDESDPEIVNAFSDYLATFHSDLREAEGLATLSELKDINKRLDNMFLDSVRTSKLSKDVLLTQLEAIKALQEKVDEADDAKKPILTGPRRDEFNDQSLVSEYRLKMLELLYIFSQDERLLRRDSSNISNPFRALKPAQRVKFPSLFKADLKKVSDDFRLLSYSEDILAEFARHNFSDIDEYAEDLEIKLGTQALRDSSFKKMFSGDLGSDELFESIKKLVFIRYTLNEMEAELASAHEARDKKEAEEQEEKEEAERARQEEERKKAEAERLEKEAKQKALDEAKKLADATDEEIQERINKLYFDVTSTGSRFVNILDLQLLIAEAKGLIPTAAEMKADNLASKVFSPHDIVKFIKQANKSGINYRAFPDCQEGADGGFNVVVSKSDERILDVPTTNIIFGNSRRDFIEGHRTWKWKTYGTVPSYFLAKIQELYNQSENENKGKYREYIYANKKSDIDVYEIGVMTTQYGGNSVASDNFFEPIIKEADKQLRKQWQDKQEDKDVLSYVSVPATYNIIPLLRAFKESGIPPYFERVPAKSARNTNNRDNIHIYFYRSDFDKFWTGVRPTLINVPEDKKVHFEIHYGKNYDFMKENSTGLKLPMLSDQEDPIH